MVQWGMKKVRGVCVVALLAAFLFVPIYAHADEASDAVAARRAQLTEQLNKLNEQIAANQAVVDKLSAQGKSLSNEVQTLNAQIKKAQLQLQATQVAVKQLDGNIAVHTNTISKLTNKLEAERESLAQIIRNTDQFDDFSLIELAFSAKNFSTFFADMDTYASLKHSLGISYDQITDTRDRTEAEREALRTQRENQAKIAQIQTMVKQTVQSEQAKKNTLLAQTKGQESAYRAVVEAQQKTAAQIRAELFALAGGSGSISLPTAIALAKQAGAATGVRPAFILGVLKQETDLGKNIGQCLLTNDPQKGDGKGKNTGRAFAGVMKPTRDVDPFMALMKSLGLDPYTQPVSCPPSYGYGGAMGPAQFIPSTWAMYQTRIAKAAGHPGSPANPYDNLDAFTATAIYMADLGASAQTPQAERTAALKYFAGGNYTNPAYSFYGDGVMGFASQFQQDIATLGN